MFKKREIVMMHTDGKETSAIMLGVMPNVATITKDVLDDVSDWMKFGTPYHLYVLSDEPLNKGDLYMSKLHSIISKYNGTEKLPEGWKKIVATTNLDLDFLLQLPQLRESFIIHFVVQYNRGNIITEIDVEYEEYHGIDTSIAEINYVSGDGSLGWKGKNDLRDVKLKININNTINIKSIKESWNREEVKPLLTFLRELKDNWDCDSDAHRYDTPCRRCEAEEILKNWDEKN